MLNCQDYLLLKDHFQKYNEIKVHLF